MTDDTRVLWDVFWKLVHAHDFTAAQEHIQGVRLIGNSITADQMDADLKTYQDAAFINSEPHQD